MDVLGPLTWTGVCCVFQDNLPPSAPPGENQDRIVVGDRFAHDVGLAGPEFRSRFDGCGAAGTTRGRPGLRARASCVSVTCQIPSPRSERRSSWGLRCADGHRREGGHPAVPVCQRGSPPRNCVIPRSNRCEGAVALRQCAARNQLSTPQQLPLYVRLSGTRAGNLRCLCTVLSRSLGYP